jgi:SAM-dependent methyltransferase
VSEPFRGSDIFAEQPGDPDLLAAIYDLEHDEVSDDLVFYRELARRAEGPVLDVGCGSGRLLRALVEGGAPRVVGVDGSAALVRRALGRIEADGTLHAARRSGRLEVVLGDVRRPPVRGPFALAVAVGVLPHLGGPEEAVRMITAASRLVEPHGQLVLDDIGPGALPWRDLPMSLDWEREMDGRRVVRRSQLTRRESPEGLWVDYATLTDSVRPDGTIARLPATFRLWYPSEDVLRHCLAEAGFTTEMTYGSHDLEPIGRESERRIVIARRVA